MSQSTDSTTPDSHKAPKWIPWVAFLLIGVPLIVWAVRTPDQEKVAAEAFLIALENKAYDDAYALLSSNAQLQFGSPAALADSLPIDEWITYNRDGSDRANNAIDASARFNGQERKSMRIRLVQDGNEAWRVDQIDGLR